MPLRAGHLVSLAARVAERSDRMKATKILVIDIERLPGLARAWDQKTRFIHINNFTRLPSLLCFAAKWHGSRTTEFHAAWDDHDAMVRRAWELYDEADIVVTYNGVRFDNRHLKSEWLLAGFPPPRPWKDVDLFAVNRSTFGFESKSLQHLCYRLGLDLKSGHYDAVMAEKCMDGDATSQRTMKRYNIGDVKITEQAWLRLRGWMPGHPMPGGPVESGELSCNQCGGSDLERNGWYRAAVQEYAAYRCRTCGANVRSGHIKRVSNTRGIR